MSASHGCPLTPEPVEKRRRLASTTLERFGCKKMVTTAIGTVAQVAPPPPMGDKKPYPCPHCRQHFSNTKALGSHIAYKHRELVEELARAAQRANQLPQLVQQHFPSPALLPSTLAGLMCLKYTSSAAMIELEELRPQPMPDLHDFPSHLRFAATLGHHLWDTCTCK